MRSNLKNPVSVNVPTNEQTTVRETQNPFAALESSDRAAGSGSV